MKMESICRASTRRIRRAALLPAAVQSASRDRAARTLHRLLRCEDAQNMVEFAFVLPLLLLAVTGVLWFGIALNQYQILTNAASAGARAFALSDNTGQTDPCNYTVSVIQGAASTLTASLMTIKWTYTPSGGTGTSYSYPTTCSGISMHSGDSVQVTLTYPVTINVFSFGTNKLTLTAQTSELVQ